MAQHLTNGGDLLYCTFAAFSIFYHAQGRFHVDKHFELTLRTF